MIKKDQYWACKNGEVVKILAYDDQSAWGVTGEFIGSTPEKNNIGIWDDDGSYTFDQEIDVLWALHKIITKEENPEYFL